jgi:hypothetical protein
MTSALTTARSRATMMTSQIAGCAACAAGVLLASGARAQPGVPASPPEASAPPRGESGAPVSPSPDTRATSALELAAFAGPSVVFGEPANPDYSPSVERIGALLAVAVTYRSSYFLAPVFEVGHAWLARGSAELPSGPWGEGGTIEQRLSTWILSPGVSAELWRLRARFGLGLGIVSQSDTFRGQTSSTSQLPVLSQLVIGCTALDLTAVRLDVEGRAVVASGADISFVGIGVSARFDVLDLGGS